MGKLTIANITRDNGFNRYILEVDDNPYAVAPVVAEQVLKNGNKLIELHVERQDLETVFVSLALTVEGEAMLNRIGSITKKEFATYFASPLAYIFLGTFLAVTLFVFFWVETFFARNIVDVRPLFEWMPILLIFLVAALTMKMWSDERRMGTLEVLLTLPVPSYKLGTRQVPCLPTPGCRSTLTHTTTSY